MALTKVSGSVLKNPLSLSGNVSVGGTLTYEDVTNIDSVGIITARSSIDAQGVISLAESIVHTGDTNTKISFPANDEISFDTSGHDRIYIKSDGKIGMGTVTPVTDIHHFSDGLNGNSLRLENREGYVTFINDADILSVDANSHYFRNRAGSSVFLVIGTSGQFGLGGTNYGTSGQVLTSQGSGSAVTWATPLNLNNATDNRVITSAGGATLNGEATLTYDGSSTLELQPASATPAIFIGDSNRTGAGQGLVQFRGNWNGTTVARITFDAGDDTTNKDDGIIRFDTTPSGGSLTERVRITSDGKIGINNDTPIHAVHIKSVMASSPSYIHMTSTGSNVNGGGGGIAFDTSATNTDETKYLATIAGIRNTEGNGSNDLVFSTTKMGVNGGVPTEKFRIDSDGKLYKGGNQFYPLVNYTEVTTFSNASTSSSSYTDLRTIMSGYSPKKAGNRIVIHHQSQMWNGASGAGSGDVYWRILKNEGGAGYSAIITNERILGNHDGWNNSGGYSGLARHHRTVHLMGSFICNGNNFDLKTQGRSIGVLWDWYHDSNNILQIWEYELN